jgi:ATP-dependent helicase/nuclease subunit B
VGLPPTTRPHPARVSHPLPSLAHVPIEVVTTPYGRPALRALRDAVTAAKAGDALAPVTVVVPSNHVGITARRLLASGALGPLGTGGAGVAAVTFNTPYRLAELLGATALAAAGRRPVSTPVLAAALRRALHDDPGMFAPVAAHPATEEALVATYAELSDLSPDALAALGAAGSRARDVVRLCGRARALLAADWYDESDLTDAAVSEVRASDDARLAAELGALVIHLPQELLRRQAVLLAALAGRLATTVVAAVTGHPDADQGVRRSLARLDVALPDGSGADPPPSPVTAATTRIVTTSDADDEVRTAVRLVLEAVRDGTPLERIGLLFGTARPYGRLVHEHLAAAGIPRNGVAVRPLAASVVGRTLLDLLALSDHDFRRADVLGLLSRATDGSATAPTAAWERASRAAGVVAGRSDWDTLLARAAAEHDRLAVRVEAAGDDRDQGQARDARRQAGRVRQLRDLVLALIDGIGDARARSAPWSDRVPWLRGLLDLVSGGAGPRESWPLDEIRAAEKIDAALDRLATLDSLAGPATLDVFRRTLEIELDADLGRVGRFGEGVLVAPLSFATGLDLDLVVLLGMAEGSLPAPVRDDALLPDADRKQALGQLTLRRDRVGRDHRQVLAALASAERHLLCLPRGDLRASNQRVASRWLADVGSTLAGARVTTDALDDPASAAWVQHVPSFAAGVTRATFPATEQEYRLRAGAAAVDDPRTQDGAAVIAARRSAAFTRFDGNLAGVGVPTPLDGVASSTRLEGWARCPFAFFGERLLEVVPAEDPELQLEMSPLTRGSLIHEVLERFVTEVLARPPERQPSPSQSWSDDDHARIRAIAGEVCAEYEAQGVTGRPVFWRRDRARVIALADRFLFADDEMRREAGSRPVAAEYRFGITDDIPPVDVPLPDGRSLHFRGSADRIDAGPAGSLLVLDYKTGGDRDYTSLSADNPDNRGTKLQLVVYAFAARARAGRPDAPVRSEYWFVSEKGGFSRRGYSVDDRVIARVTETLDTIVTGIERGTFPAHPVETFGPWGRCPWCDPDGLGVSDLRRAWDRKRHDPAVRPYAELAEPEEAAAR